MLATTRAIVLHKTNYSESSIVAQLFTFEYGKISIIVHGIKKKRSKHKIALFEPLSLIEIVANFNDPQKLIHPIEIKLDTPLIQIQSSIIKRSLVLFIAELLHKSIKEPQPEKAMFIYIENSLKYLELTQENVANFHITFLTELTKYLGFYPKRTEGNYFDIMNGCFSKSLPESHLYVEGIVAQNFIQVLGTRIDKSSSLVLNTNQRKDILNLIINYYKIHVSGLREINSHLILESIFS